MKKTYVLSALALGAIGLAAAATVQFAAPPVAAAQASGPLMAGCRAWDAQGQFVFSNSNGETVLFVPRGDALMRDRGGPRTSYEPTLRNRVASMELKQGCRAVLYGQFGATWGHRNVTATGPTGVPANHIGGVKCECS